MIFFEEGDNYYKPIRIGNFWNKDYIEYGRSGDKNKKLSLSVKEYLRKVKAYLSDIIIDLQNSGTCII